MVIVSHFQYLRWKKLLFLLEIVTYPRTAHNHTWKQLILLWHETIGTYISQGTGWCFQLKMDAHWFPFMSKQFLNKVLPVSACSLQQTFSNSCPWFQCKQFARSNQTRYKRDLWVVNLNLLCWVHTNLEIPHKRWNIILWNTPASELSSILKWIFKGYGSKAPHFKDMRAHRLWKANTCTVKEWITRIWMKSQGNSQYPFNVCDELYHCVNGHIGDKDTKTAKGLIPTFSDQPKYKT